MGGDAIAELLVTWLLGSEPEVESDCSCCVSVPWVLFVGGQQCRGSPSFDKWAVTQPRWSLFSQTLGKWKCAVFHCLRADSDASMQIISSSVPPESVHLFTRMLISTRFQTCELDPCGSISTFSVLQTLLRM